MQKVRVGFIGAGQFITSSHLPTAINSTIMRATAIADLNPDLLDKHRKAIPSVRTTRNYRDVLTDPAIDLVVIGTRQDLHAQLIVESLEAGKWVYCEKPMAETEEEIERVLAAEASSPGRLAIGLNRRFAPSMTRAKQLMQAAPRPWYLYYRLMAPHLVTGEKGDFYRDRPRIIYEGCHVLDLICWLFDATPARVTMTGDRTRNNAALLEFHDGSSASLLCGSVGSFSLTKEYMELFAHGRSITVSDFVDMRVRGFEGEADQIFPLDRGAHGQEIQRHGFDFYETCRTQEILHNTESMALIRQANMTLEPVQRHLNESARLAADAHQRCIPPYFDSADKGRVQALEHFAQCLRAGQLPQTADGHAGARSTWLGLRLLESLMNSQPATVSFEDAVLPQP